MQARLAPPDPFIPDATATQSYNRYSYCINNPLKYTDPSGYIDKPADWNKGISGALYVNPYFNGGFTHFVPGSGNHWSDQYRTSDGNWMLGNHATYDRLYGSGMFDHVTGFFSGEIPTFVWNPTAGDEVYRETLGNNVNIYYSGAWRQSMYKWGTVTCPFVSDGVDAGHGSNEFELGPVGIGLSISYGWPEWLTGKRIAGGFEIGIVADNRLLGIGIYITTKKPHSNNNPLSFGLAPEVFYTQTSSKNQINIDNLKGQSIEFMGGAGPIGFSYGYDIGGTYQMFTGSAFGKGIDIGYGTWDNQTNVHTAHDLVNFITGLFN
ncbi:MAG: hypothetical protein KKG99_06290 [Bacteroidetes bacterium]|nr:hypothetical protein [Bacteroidota bacterium]